ncbi:MAG TPA: helix-turn-helix transcriptional regulator [Caulobacteraceae bacterium]|nr:helix-turn-helix transcriptional regulator [Caulobacteraceae bacterium]
MTALTFIQGGEGQRRVWRRELGDAGSPSAITVLNGRSREAWIRDAEGAFSIKWMPRGRAVYRTEGASHFLGGASAVILNPAQPYELEFLDRSGTESLCVFVSDDLVAEAWRDIAEPDGLGDGPPGRIPQFPDLVFTPPPSLLDELATLRESYGADDPSALAAEERLLGLLGRLVRAAQGHRRMAARLPAAKASTRRLLAARVERARELIESSSEEPTLDDLARAAAVSKFHLLRLFKAAFGCTPSAYAGRRRMERAKRLLRATPMTVASIGEALGYESTGAFVRAFRRHFGVAPSAIRP